MMVGIQMCISADQLEKVYTVGGGRYTDVYIS